MDVARILKSVSIDQYVKDAIILYGNETLMNRTVPDFRDGMKPVQRRVVYWMSERGGRNRMKAARVVGGCFVAGTMVSTPTGEVAIEDLKIGDEVNTSNGVRKVVEIFIQPSKPLKKITTKNKYSNCCTPDQEFRVLVDGVVVWKRADELQLGDKILVEKAHGSSNDTCGVPAEII